MNIARHLQFKLLTNRLQANFIWKRQRKQSFEGLTKNVTVSSTQSPKLYFGFEAVTESERERKVHKMFTEMANSYDRMIDVMSLGIHRIWKDILIERLGPQHGTRLLDMGGGTGDIPIRYLNYLKHQSNPKDLKSHLTVLDINQNMLNVGVERARILGLTEQLLPNISIEWKCGDAEKIPFPDNTFSAYTASFGVRNCTNKELVLREAYRVLQPGGRFLCLEFSHLNNVPLKYLYNCYSDYILPHMFLAMNGNLEKYEYLTGSIRKFPNQVEFKRMIEEVGFKMVHYENLTFGVVCIHSGFKLEK